MDFNEAIFLDNIGKIMVFLMVLFAVFLMTVKSSKRFANRIFAAFLLVTAFDLTGLFLGQSIAEVDFIQRLKTASSLLQMPLFYLYVLAVCHSNFRFQMKHALHLLPFLLFFLLFSVEVFPNHMYGMYHVTGEIQYMAYIVAIFMALKKHRTVYLENFSNPDYSAYKWLLNATILFCLAHSLVLMRLLLEYFGLNQLWGPMVNSTIGVSALLVTCWLVMKAMYKPQLFIGTETQLEPIKPKTSLTETPHTKASLKKLRTFMEQEKPYLNYELSIKKLASQIEMEEKDLSTLINLHTGKHFFNFINTYRIAEAKTILENPDMSTLTIQEILYKVGFNSKSSFYTAFKKEMGQTPINYRKSFH